MAANLRVGELRHRITFQQRSATQDAVYGAQTLSWVDYLTVWAHIEPLTAREVFNTANYASEVSHVITVRYRPEFADTRAVAALRVTYNGRLFNIRGAMNIDERNRIVQLLAGEGLNNG